MNYIWDSEFSLWHRENIKSVPYSDGEGVERRLFEIIKNAQNRSTFSPELANSIADWPSEYHLSRSRHCLVRPLGIKAGERVLELGCGCGAITRYLGEIGAEVTAVEGSEARARIAAERCRDLPNVKVVLDDLLQFSTDERFDWVILIGVLEYAPVFSGESDPVGHYLRTVSTFLGSKGKLVVAIENRLGLKYFNGCAEDHLGVPFFGIEDLYGKRTPVTLGRKELADKLSQAGFTNKNFFYPFPDYKLPNVVLSETGCREQGFDTPDLLLRSHPIDYRGSPYRLFDDGLVFSALDRNGLLEELSNSFLIVAAVPGVDLYKPETLAWTFAVNRLPQYVTETRFIKRDNRIHVVKVYAGPPLGGNIYPDGESALQLHVAEKSYVHGRQILWRVIRAQAQGANADQIAESLMPWFEYLIKLARPVSGIVEVDALKRPDLSDFVVSGDLIDCTPFNVLKTESGQVPIDEEWEVPGEVPLGYVVTRGVFWSLRVGLPRANRAPNVDEVVEALCSKRGLTVSANSRSKWFGAEVQFQSAVAGRAVDSVTWNTSCNGLRQVFAELSAREETIRAREETIRAREETIRAREETIRAREETIHVHEGEIFKKNSELHAVLTSKSWRWTEFIRRSLKSARSALRRWGLYRR